VRPVSVSVWSVGDSLESRVNKGSSDGRAPIIRPTRWNATSKAEGKITADHYSVDTHGENASGQVGTTLGRTWRCAVQTRLPAPSSAFERLIDLGTRRTRGYDTATQVRILKGSSSNTAVCGLTDGYFLLLQQEPGWHLLFSTVPKGTRRQAELTGKSVLTGTVCGSGACIRIWQSDARFCAWPVSVPAVRLR